MMLTATLLVIFLAHLVAFAVLGLRRRQAYYGVLMVTFALLSAAMAVRLFAPEPATGGGIDVAQWLRYAAWVSAAVSVSWTLSRIYMRWARRQVPSG